MVTNNGNGHAAWDADRDALTMDADFARDRATCFITEVTGSLERAFYHYACRRPGAGLTERLAAFDPVIRARMGTLLRGMADLVEGKAVSSRSGRAVG